MAESRKFTKEQLILLAKTVCSSFTAQFNLSKDSKKKQKELNKSLVQMFQMIILIKNEQIKKKNKQLELQMYRKIELDHQNNFMHLSHLDQQQVDKLCAERKSQKLFSRIVDIKNEKVSQLGNMAKKYDQLYKISKQLKQKEQKLIKQVQDLKLKEKQNLQQIASLTMVLNEQNQQIATLNEKLYRVQQKLENLREKFQTFKHNYFSDIKNMRQSFQNCLKEIINDSVKSILQVADKYLKERKQRQNQKLQFDKAKQQDGRTIRELVFDLSIAANFPKKESEDQTQWIAEYRKLKILREGRLQYQTYKQNIYPRGPDSEVSRFVTQQSLSLKEFATKRK